MSLPMLNRPLAIEILADRIHITDLTCRIDAGIPLSNHSLPTPFSGALGFLAGTGNGFAR
jgi:hypothetical protein